MSSCYQPHLKFRSAFRPRLFFINTNLHFTQHDWGYIRTIELTTVTEFLEASQPPCIRCIFQIFYPRKSNKGVKMSWQREVKPKWVGISKWGSDSGKNLWGRPLDALFGPCQHLSNLDLMIKRKIKIFVSEIVSLLLKGIWVELPRSITDFRKKYPGNNVCWSRRCKCIQQRLYDRREIWNWVNLTRTRSEECI